MNTSTLKTTERSSRWPDYATFWRWHFYAGLFCIPFICWLALTGSIYLFRPQIEDWQDKPFTRLVHPGDTPAAPSAQIRAALATQPNSVLHAYQLPATADAAPQVLIGRGAQEWRVWIHPVTLQPLKVVAEDDRLMRVIFHLHGELLLGDRGSIAVELAASWAIVMILTGLYLWWPRNARGLGGVLYPRLGRGSRVFWRDLHASTGMWVSIFTLFLLISGLPWAKSWGGYLKEVRSLAGPPAAPQDWTTGSGSELAQRSALSAGSLAAQHRSQAGNDSHSEHHHGGGYTSVFPLSPDAYSPADRIAPAVARLDLPFPVLITPPQAPAGPWSARSDTADRPERVDLTLDQTGSVLERKEFNQHGWVDRWVGIGVAAHEGQLFGWPNQLLGLFTAAGLITLCVSSVILWWNRRPEGLLGAPNPMLDPRFSIALLIAALTLAVLLPLLGASLAAVLVAERLLFRRISGLRVWLGLRPDV